MEDKFSATIGMDKQTTREMQDQYYYNKKGFKNLHKN
jgi:hypothetical protein